MAIILFSNASIIFLSSHDNGVLPVIFYALIVIPFVYLTCIKHLRGCLPSFAIFFMLIGNYLFYLYGRVMGSLSGHLLPVRKYHLE